MLRVFIDSLLPVFLAAGGGYLLAAKLELRPRPIAQLAFNLFAPCLVFHLIVGSRVPGATTQVYLQYWVDLISITVLLHASGGIGSGLGGLLP